MANALKYQWSPDEAIEKLYQKGFMDGRNVGFLQTLIDSTIEIEDIDPQYAVLAAKSEEGPFGDKSLDNQN